MLWTGNTRLPDDYYASIGQTEPNSVEPMTTVTAMLTPIHVRIIQTDPWALFTYDAIHVIVIPWQQGVYEIKLHEHKGSLISSIPWLPWYT